MINKKDKEIQMEFLINDLRDAKEKLLFHASKSDRGNMQQWRDTYRGLKAMLKEKIEVVDLIVQAEEIEG